MIRRREFLIGAGAAVVAGPAVVRAEETTVIKMGALKLIHSIAPYFYEKFTPAGYKVEVIPFESPAEGKNAVVTKSVDFGMFGIAAATLGAAAGEPIVVIASACNRGMAVIAGKGFLDQLDQGPERQKGRHLAGLDAGGVYFRTSAHGRHVGCRHHARACLLQ